jgi:hypothetical protein
LRTVSGILPSNSRIQAEVGRLLVVGAQDGLNALTCAGEVLLATGGQRFTALP